MSKHPLYNATGLIKNNKPMVLYALVNKKSELTGEILELKKKLSKIETDLLHINESIRIFDPYLDVKVPPKKINPVDSVSFEKGELRRLILLSIDDKNYTISTAIYENIAIKKGIDISISKIRQLFIKKVSKELDNMVIYGKINKQKLGAKPTYIISKEYMKEITFIKNEN